MKSSQEYFDNAYQNYNNALALIEKLWASATDGQGVDALKKQFDVIVQYVLLKVAIADGNFSEIEGVFLDNLTDNLKILHLFGLGGDEYNWQFAALNLQMRQIQAVIGEVEKSAHEPMFTFAKTIAPVVAHTDCLDRLFQHVKNIAACFILCDGNGTVREVEVASDTVVRCLVNPWKNAAAKQS